MATKQVIHSFTVDAEAKENLELMKKHGYNISKIIRILIERFVSEEIKGKDHVV